MTQDHTPPRPPGLARLDTLFRAAVQAHYDLSASYTLRMEALSGICAEMAAGTGDVFGWLTDRVGDEGYLIIPMSGGGDPLDGFVILVRDPHTHGWRGASGADLTLAAAACAVYHLAAITPLAGPT